MNSPLSWLRHNYWQLSTLHQHHNISGFSAYGRVGGKARDTEWQNGIERSMKINMQISPDGHYLLSDNPINILRPRQNGRHFPDDIFKYIFWNENISILIKTSLKFCSQGYNQQCVSIGSDNDLTLARPQVNIWTNDGYITDAYMRHAASMT